MDYILLHDKALPHLSKFISSSFLPTPLLLYRPPFSSQDSGSCLGLYIQYWSLCLNVLRLFIFPRSNLNVVLPCQRPFLTTQSKLGLSYYFLSQESLFSLRHLLQFAILYFYHKLLPLNYKFHQVSNHISCMMLSTL